MKNFFVAFIVLLATQIFAQSSTDKGISLYNQKKYSSAKEVFKSILDKNEVDAEAHIYLAKCLIELGNLDEAIEHGEIAIALDDKNADYHFELGLLYAEDARDASIFRAPFVAGKVKDQFLKTLELDPNHLEGRIGLAEFYLQAPGIAGGDFDKALEQAKIIEAMNKMRGGFLIARIYIEKENYTKAESKLKELETKFGEDAEFYYFYNSYGYFLLGQNRIDEAIDKFKKQISLAPKEANPYDSLGEAYRTKGLLKESLQQYQKAYSISPSERVEEIIEELKEEIEGN